MNYSTEITEDEIDLGFQRLEIDGLREQFNDLQPGVAIAKILSPCEILVKTESGYSHLIFGRTPIPTRMQNPIWQCAFEHDTRDAAQFLHDYSVGGLLAEDSIPLMERCAFSARESKGT